MEKTRITESPIEEMLKNTLEARGIDFITQEKIGRYRVDFCFSNSFLVVETQGKAYHSTPEQFDKDFRRAQYIMRKGYLVLWFKGSQIFRDVETCVDKIEDLLNLGNKK